MANGLVPDIAGSISRGLSLRDQIQQMQQAGKVSQIRGALAGIGQPEELPTGFEGPPQLQQEADLIEQAKQVDPVLAEQQLQLLGLDSASKREEASRFAAGIQSLPPELQNQRIQQRAADLRARGRDPKDTLELLDMNPQQRTMALRGVQLMALSTKERFGVTERGKIGVQFGAQQTFKDEKGNLFFGTTRRNPATGQVESALAPIGKGPTDPIGKVELVTPLGLTAKEKITQEAAEEEAKAAAKETAVLKTQFRLKPQVEAAVRKAVEAVKVATKEAGEQKSNEIALNVYETAMSGLIEGLGETVTGPIVGRLPAFTANQQIAEGAVAAMAPILKQMFRSAGEGTFTDKDQELLLDMVPTRKDEPEARQSKINNIDAIIRAKLGQLPSGQPVVPRETPATQIPAQQIQEGQTATNLQTGEKLIFRGGQWQTP